MSNRFTFALPIPKLDLGVSWTGYSLLNYIVDKGDDNTKKTLCAMKEVLGPEKFRDVFEDKAVELNLRFAARRLDGDKAVN